MRSGCGGGCGCGGGGEKTVAAAGGGAGALCAAPRGSGRLAPRAGALLQRAVAPVPAQVWVLRLLLPAVDACAAAAARALLLQWRQMERRRRGLELAPERSRRGLRRGRRGGANFGAGGEKRVLVQAWRWRRSWRR